MLVLVLLAAIFNAGFALFHLFFWRIFKWRSELPRLGFANRGIVQVLNLCLTYFFTLAAVLLLVFPSELISSGLGRAVLLGLAGFWTLRAAYQPMFWGLRHRLSVALFGIFVAGALLHSLAWWAACNN